MEYFTPPLWYYDGADINEILAAAEVYPHTHEGVSHWLVFLNQRRQKDAVLCADHLHVPAEIEQSVYPYG